MDLKTRIFIILLIILTIISKFILVSKNGGNLIGIENIEGMVISKPIISNNIQSFTVKNINIQTSKNYQIEIGDIVKISGTYQERVINPLYKEKYLNTKDLIIESKYSDNTIKKRVFKYANIELMYRLSLLKQWAIRQYNTKLSYDSAGLLAGMVLGAKEALSYDLYSKMKASGLAHLVVASGSNIVLVAVTVLAMLASLSKFNKYVVTLVIIWMYALLAGMDPPIVRATIMLSMIWMARLIGRKTSGIWVLFITSLIMLIINPYIIFSLSFQLSIAATTGLILYCQPLETIIIKLLPKRKLFKWFAGVIVQPLAAQILIMPLMLHYFGTTNLLSIIANMAVAFLVTPIVIGGMLSLMASFIPLLGSIIAIPLELALNYLNRVGSYTATLSFANLNVEIGWLTVIIYWVVPIALLIYFNKLASTKDYLQL